MRELRRPALHVLMVAAAAVVVLAGAVVWGTGLFEIAHETGYLGAIFSPDGGSIVAVRRDARAIVTGLGLEVFTPPATVRVQRDRFELLSVRVPDGRTTVLETFPPSPLEGQTIEAYHRAIFGTATAHLHWADPRHLEYEIAVSRHDTPASRTFVLRRVFSPAGAVTGAAAWSEGPATVTGYEPQILHGDLEALVVPGEEMMPCAIALLRRDGRVSTLVETRTCHRKYRAGITAAVLQPLSRRADIERDEKVRNTYAKLIADRRNAGMTEIQASLAAIKEMQRLGLYPRSTTLVAQPATCGAGDRTFEISDEEFQVGLFQDIERAIAKPGEPVDRMGDYLTYRGYTTSKDINEYIQAGHSSFVVKTAGRCWRLTIER